jgi:hypothetical protein
LADDLADIFADVAGGWRCLTPAFERRHCGSGTSPLSTTGASMRLPPSVRCTASSPKTAPSICSITLDRSDRCGTIPSAAILRKPDLVAQSHLSLRLRT